MCVPEDGFEFLEKSYGAFEEALEVYTQVDFPQDWMMVQNNLGLAFRELSRRSEGKERWEFLLASRNAYIAVLSECVEEDLLQYWAAAQNNLGLVLKDLGTSVEVGAEREEFLQASKAAFKAALEVYSKEDFPRYFDQIQENLIFLSRELEER